MLLEDIPLKVSVIGLGQCGTSLTQLLLGCKDYSLHINLVDPSPYTEGAWLDLAHATAATGRHSVVRNDPAVLARSHFIFHAAGKNSSPGASRNTVLEENIRLTQQIFNSVDLRPDARVIVITNPVDIITYYTMKASGLPAAQVIGTGTLLDGHRLQWLLHEHTGVPLADIQACVLGEHGSSMTPIFSRTHFGTQNGNDLTPKEKSDLTTDLRGTATRIRQTAEATRWAVAACAYELMLAFLNPPHSSTLASICLDQNMQKRLDVGEMCLGMPVRFEEDGCHCDGEFEMEEQEWEALRRSARLVQGLMGGIAFG